MTDLSLRQYLESISHPPSQGVRSCCAPNVKTISLRSLILSLRIIHISDPHFSDSKYYLNTGGSIGLKIQEQDSAKRSETLVNYLIQNRDLFRTNKVVITGDLTDSGDDGDYKNFAQPFIQRLKDANFEVYAVPGNHDYCKMGTLAVNNDAIKNALKDVFCSICPAREPFTGACADDIGLPCPLDELPLIKDNATMQVRRQRFIHYITGYSQYPHVVDFDNGRLILLDSMQAELDENTGDLGAEGKLGDTQLSRLSDPFGPIKDYQEERKKGKKLIVGLHHSPFDANLKDADKLLEILNYKIDCLLFGHTTPDGRYQQPSSIDDSESNKKINNNQAKIPLINCVNMQNIEDDGIYPITVLDLSSYQRVVYKTNGREFEYSWGNPF